MKFRKKHIEAILFISLIFFLFLSILFYNLNFLFIDKKYEKQILEDNSWQNRFEYRIYDSIPNKPAFNEIYGAAQEFMGKRIVMDMAYGNLYKSKYDQIVFPVFSNKKELNGILSRFEIFNNQLKAEGIPLLYVQAPYKVPKNEKQLPEICIDYSNSNMDKLLEGLNKKGIETLDLRDKVFDGNKSQNELFYNTDHHWKIETAFNATWHIAQYLNNKHNFQINIGKYGDISNYKKTTVEKCFIGSQGRRVGKIYGGIDDFTYIIPKFETDYKLIEADEEPAKVYEGSFEKAVLDPKYMPKDKSDLTLNRYAVYHGDNRELIFENKLENKGKILFIKDSFGVPIYSFLSLGIYETRAIDLRLFKSSVIEYVKYVKPDIVIVLYNIDHVEKTLYNFEGENE